MVMAQSLFIAVKQRWPHASIDVLAPKWSRPLLERMPEVRAAIDLPFAHRQLALKGRYQLAQSLRHRYDQAIVLPNSFKSALIPFWAKIPIRTGWRGEWRYGLLNDIRILDKSAYPKMVERFFALAWPVNEQPKKSYPYPKLHVNEANRFKTLTDFGLNTLKPVVILCPGAEFGPSKQWPASYYAQVAQDLIAKGCQIWIMGSNKDRLIASAIQSKISDCIDLTGRTTLAQAIDLTSLAKEVITNDSGLMHIAAALDCHIIAIYGSTDPSFTPPLSTKTHIIKSNLTCSPCFKRTCPYGHHHCMKNIYPEQVLKASLI